MLCLEGAAYHAPLVVHPRLCTEDGEWNGIYLTDEGEPEHGPYDTSWNSCVPTNTRCIKMRDWYKTLPCYGLSDKCKDGALAFLDAVRRCTDAMKGGMGESSGYDNSGRRVDIGLTLECYAWVERQTRSCSRGTRAMELAEFQLDILIQRELDDVCSRPKEQADGRWSWITQADAQLHKNWNAWGRYAETWLEGCPSTIEYEEHN